MLAKNPSFKELTIIKFKLFILTFIFLSFTSVINAQAIVNYPYTNFCSGNTLDISTALGSAATGRTFTWTFTNNASITGAQANPSSPSSSIIQTLTLITTASSANQVFTVTNDLGVKSTITVTVLAVPTISNISTWNGMSYGCGNNINFTAASTITVATTGWSWSRPAILDKPALSGNSNLINDNLIDTTASEVNIPYTVVMNATNGCSNQQILTYKISPTPIISDTLRYDSICSGTTVTYTPKTQLASSLFTWGSPTVTASGLTGTSTGTKLSNFNQNITNTTSSTIIATYNIQPVISYTGFTCTGLTYQKFVVVNPRPKINNTTITACSGAPFRFTPVTSGNIIPINTQYSWSLPQYSDPALISGGQASVQLPQVEYTDPPIIQTLSNKSLVAQTATYNIYARAGYCISTDPFDLIATVNPVPAVTLASDTITVCSGTAPTFSPTSSLPTGTTYTWNVPQISPASSLSGTGINAQSNQSTFAPVLNNLRTTTSYATFTVVPNTPQNCPGLPFKVTVIVNPVAIIATQNIVSCSNDNFISSPNPVPQGTTYTWGSPTLTTGMIVNSGNHHINPNGDTAITGNVSYLGVDAGGRATFSVTPKSGVCYGAPFSVVLTTRPLPVVSTASKIACSGVQFSSSPTSNLISSVTTSYTWGLPVISPANAILGASANTSPVQSITQTLFDTTLTIAQATYTVIPIAQGCAGSPFTFVATINPSPKISNKDTIICPGYPFSVNPSPLPFVTTYTWEAPVYNIPNAIIGGAQQTSPVPNFSQVLTNTTNSIDVAATYKLTPYFGGCAGSSFSLVVTVKASPYITDTLKSTTCSESPFSVSMPQNMPLGCLYKWEEPTYINGITGGSAQNLLQPNISQILKNTNGDTTSGNAFYSVTPVANGCVGSNFVVKVTVKSNAAILTSPLNPPAICSGNNFMYQPTSSLPGTSFVWTRDSLPGLQNPSSAGFADINELLIDTTGNPLTVNYKYSLLYNGCTSSKTQIVSVIVNPKPVLTSPFKPLPICSGNTFNYTPVSSTRDVNFTWSRSYVVGIAEPLTQGGSSISEQLTNTTVNIVQVPYVFSLSANGCTNQQTVYEIVNPVLTLNDQTSPVCSGNNFTITPPNVVNAVFLWNMPQIDNGIIGATDNKLIPQSALSGTLTNLADTPNVALYELIPIIPGANTGGCLGEPFKVKLVVNPVPVLNSPSVMPSICSGSNFTYTPTSKTPGTIFSWSRDSIPGIRNKPQKGSFAISETIIDTTIYPIVVTYNYRTTFSGCTDSTQSVSFTVNPAPVINDQRITICSGSPFSVPSDLEPMGTTYTWSLPAIMPTSALKSYTAKPTAQTLIYDTLNNLTTADAIAVYNIIPNNPVCKLQPFNVFVTVKPISLIGDQTIISCNSKPVVYSPLGVPSGTTYKWKFNEPNPSFALSGYNSNDSVFKPFILQTLYNSSNNSVNAGYLIETSTNGCIGKSFQLKTVVHPTPKVQITGQPIICKNAIDTLQLQFTGTGPWSINYIDNKDRILTMVSGFNNPNSIYVQNRLPNDTVYDFKVLNVSDAFCSTDAGFAGISFAQKLNKLPVTSINTPQGTLICNGLTQAMLVSPLQTKYQWYRNDTIIPNARSVNYNAFIQGSYKAFVTDSLGCGDFTVNTVKMSDLKDFTVSFTNDKINCIDQIKQFINQTDTSSVRNVQWKWNFNGEDSSLNFNPLVVFKKAGLKKIVLSANLPSCTYSIQKDTLILIGSPITPKKLAPVTTNSGKSVQLQAREFEGTTLQYDWQPGWGIDFFNIKNPIFDYSKSQIYYIKMTSPDGCVSVDTLNVFVFDSSIVNVFVPKSFSPNGDGNNDVLYPYLSNIRQLNYFKIYNKYSRLVFESKNSAEGWNGMSFGQQQPMDVYLWIAEAIDKNGNKVVKNGNVLLIR